MLLAQIYGQTTSRSAELTWPITFRVIAILLVTAGLVYLGIWLFRKPQKQVVHVFKHPTTETWDEYLKRTSGGRPLEVPPVQVELGSAIDPYKGATAPGQPIEQVGEVAGVAIYAGQRPGGTAVVYHGTFEEREKAKDEVQERQEG